MAKKPVPYIVAGGALKEGEPFNLKCNCGGNAPITPASTKGYGYSKKGGATKIVDELECDCESCGAKIKAMVLEGDPGYLLIRTPEVGEHLFCPPGSSFDPVEKLSKEEQADIIAEIKKL